MKPIVIIGAGLAGYTLAREFRKLDADTPLTIISSDDGRFYSKPMLSSALSQRKTAAQLASASAAQMAENLKAEVITHTAVTRLDPAAHQIATERTVIGYAALILAVGALPIRPAMAGDGADDVMLINNLADYSGFRERILDAKQVAVIGPGLIGCEFANDLATQGIRVSVIGPDPAPISNLLPLPVGRDLQQALSAKLGVAWHLRATASVINRVASGLELRLSSGAMVPADAVLAAVGLRPNTDLAREAGLAINRGIVADRFLRTNRQDIFALGDCAEIAGLNLPYVMPIMHGAKALAGTLAGTPTQVRYPAMPVVIKTLSHPVLVAPPPRGCPGDWEIETLDDGIEALFRSPDRNLTGFALSGQAVEQKQTLIKQLPPVLS